MLHVKKNQARERESKRTAKKRDFFSSSSSSDEVVKLQPIIEHRKQLFCSSHFSKCKRNEQTTPSTNLPLALRQSAMVNANIDGKEKEKSEEMRE